MNISGFYRESPTIFLDHNPCPFNSQKFLFMAKKSSKRFTAGNLDLRTLLLALNLSELKSMNDWNNYR